MQSFNLLVDSFYFPPIYSRGIRKERDSGENCLGTFQGNKAFLDFFLLTYKFIYEKYFFRFYI